MNRKDRTRNNRTRRATGLRVSALTVLLITLFSLFTNLLPLLDLQAMPVRRAEAAGALSVQIVAAYNLVVDSNAKAPSTYAPSVATVFGRFCNTGDAALTNVVGYIGNYTNTTSYAPGIYPARRSTDSGFQPSVLIGSGSYSFVHVGGRTGTADATRYIGSIPAGQCRVQYWHFKYPQCGNVGSAWNNPPCNDGGFGNEATWGDSVKPSDDLWLNLDIWGTSDQGTASATWKMTMRNEISAMANKIKPNPDGEWFNTKTNNIEPGGLITSNGILYEIGVANQGFDNDGDYVPDYNAWMQPIGDASYDPSCFRIVKVSSIFTVTRSGGNPDLVLHTDDLHPHPVYGGPLYYTNLPPDNTGTRGEVFYTFQAQTGPCQTAVSPYQEVASGYDNEKFNGDYGIGVPPLGSVAPKATVDKSASPNVISLGSTTTYQIPFANPGATPVGMGLSQGGTSPLVISDTVPTGMQYVGGSATYNLAYSPNTGVTRRYSTNSGVTWSTTDPGTVLSTWPNNKVIIQWWLNDSLPAGSSGSYAQFQATVPGTYTGSSFIDNCAEGSLGLGVPFDRACAMVMVRGNNSIGDLVWKDEDGDSMQDGGATEPGINGVTVKLYWDKNSNGSLDSGDVQLGTVSRNVYDGKIDLNNSGAADGSDDGEFDAYNIIDGLVDVNGDNAITAADDGTALINGYNVIDGYLDMDGNGSITTADDGKVIGTMVASQSATVTDGLLNIFNGTFAGYNTNASGRLDINGDGLFDANDDGTALIGGYNTGTSAVVLYNVIDGYIDVTGNGAIGTDDDATLSGNYGYAYLPNGYYIVQVTTADADIPTGYGLTTQKQYAVNLSAGGVNNRTSDFGFGPSLKVQKTLTSENPSYEGDLVTYRIDLKNSLPGDGTGKPAACTYMVYAQHNHLYGGGDIPVSSNNKWQNQPNALNAPDSQFATLVLSSANDDMGLGNFNAAAQSSSITKVELVAYMREIVDFKGSSQKDILLLQPYYNNIALTGQAYDSSYFTKTAPADYVIVRDITSLRTWTWSDFASDLTELLVEGQKGNQNPTGEMWADALAYRITTNQSCGDPSGTIDPLPLTDTFDNAKLQFISASPPETSVAGGTVTWNNLGPLYPGQTKYVYVTFKALPIAGSTPVSHQNCGNVTGAYFVDGRPVNNASSCVTHNINPTAKIGDYIWSDLDSDGVQDAGEPPIPNVRVYLCSGSVSPCNASNAIKTTWTDASGLYYFEGARNQQYTVAVDTTTLPPGWTRTYDFDGTGTPDYSVTTIANATDDLRQDFGYIFPAYLYGNVWEDANGDSNRGTNDTGIPGVTVYLCTSTPCGSGNAIQTKTTDANGNYLFGNLTGGTTYYVGIANTLSPLGSDWINTRDPEGAPGNHQFAGVTVTAGHGYGSYDFGYYRGGTYRLGDTVYTDWNGNATQDAGEEGIPNITVSLYEDDDADGVIDPEDGLVLVTVTNSSGKYYFPNRGAGSYIVVVDKNDADFPSGYRQTQDPDQDGIVCTNCDSRGLATLGPNDLTVDFGYQPYGSGAIGDFVWKDLDRDTVQDGGSETGIGNIVVKLYEDSNGNGIIDANDAVVATRSTMYNVIDGKFDVNGDGSITAADDATGFQINNSTTRNIIDGQLDMNGDGSITAADDGTLYGYSIYTVIDGVIDINGDGSANASDDNSTLLGKYLFSGLRAGRYLVDVDTADPDLPDDASGNNYVLTTANDPQLVVLTAGQSYLGADFGFTPGGIIGDFIWKDTNGDGQQDIGEPGISGVTVRLYVDVDGDGVYDPGTDTPYGTKTTDANGIYEFTGLPAGKYVVVVDTGTLPSGYTQTGDPDLTTVCSGGTCDSQSGVTLTPGQVDRLRDFGYRPQNLIGDTLWIDSDRDGTQDSGESGIPYITVRLYTNGADGVPGNGDDILWGTTATDSNGKYAFAGMPDGSYNVRVDTTDADWPSGVLPTYDPDESNPCTVCNNIGNATVGASNRTVLTVDFGYYYYGVNSIAGTVFYDTDNDAVQDAGETITYAGVTVYLWNANHQLIGTTVTDSSGNYSFPNLPDGNYTVSYDPDSPQLVGLSPTNTSSPTTYHNVALDPGGTNPNPVNAADQDFGVISNVDTGDLPNSYNTLLANNGPRHVIGSLRLGSAIDADPNGQPNTAATGDDLAGIDDEDGISYVANNYWTPGSGYQITANVNTTGGYLVAWFDWNEDGDFADAGEMVDLGATAAGNNVYNRTVPGTSTMSTYVNARFRLYAGRPADLSPQGLVYNGEVEDYKWQIYPTAVRLVSFEARPQVQNILVTWETASEDNNAGFNLYRREVGTETYVRLNGALIPSLAPGQGQGARYAWVDDGVVAGTMYEYLLESVDMGGMTAQYGPVVVQALHVVFYPMIVR